MGCMGKHHSVAQVLQKPLDWDQPMATHIHALYWMRNAICYRSIQSLFKHMCDSHSTKAAAFHNPKISESQCNLINLFTSLSG